jgi:expansin
MRALVIAACLLIACSGDRERAGSGGGGASGPGSGPTTGSGAGQPCAGAETHEGEATYYDFADGSGNCGFPATPDDLMVAAMNQTDYAGSAPCGACAHVVGPSGEVTVRIVDRCPECAPGDLDLSPEAFALIADLELGRVPMSWQYVECGVSGPIVYHFKDGSNPYWTAVQIRNHRHAIAAFAFDGGGGSWNDVARLDYNYFVADAGMGEGPYHFRVTDVVGNVIEDSGIALMDDGDVSGTQQFPACAP